MIPQTFIFIGRSGCGKGTQAKLLIDYLKTKDHTPVCYIETGARFREFVADSNYTSTLSRQIMDRAGLQPTFLAVWMWAHLLIDGMKGDEHLILDGVARTKIEAETLANALKFYERQSPVIIYLEVSAEWSRARLTARGRGDDQTSSSIDTRLAWFDREVKPVVEWYAANPAYRFLTINGEQTVEQVHTAIVNRL